MNPDRELSWLRKVQELSQELAFGQNLTRLLPRILDAAIELTDAERGYLVRVEEVRGQQHRVRIVAARGFAGAALRKSSGDISQTVVERVMAENRGVVTTHEEDADLLTVSSVEARRVRSIISVPLRLRGEVRGALYLDHRFQGDAFAAPDLPILESFAGQAALAIETAELRTDHAHADERLRATLGELERLQADEGAAEPTPDAGIARFGRLFGAAPAMIDVYEEIERAARTWDPVLILGGWGSGKRLVAGELHARAGGAPEELQEVDFAFLPADAPDPLEPLRAAAPGTMLLLSHIDQMPADRQRELLRLLKERPVGPGCRLVGTSTVDLRAAAAAGDFREDLYYRLDVGRITIPPLRERPVDIPLLIANALEQQAARLSITPRAHKLLAAYAWPGNVRELENEVSRLARLGQREISGQQLSPEIREGRGVSRGAGETAGKTLAEVEKSMVEAALRDCAHNKAQAARQLGVPRSTLYSLIKRYQLE